MRIFCLHIACLLGFFQCIAQYKQHQPLRDYYTARAIGSERAWQRIYIGAGKHIAFGSFSLVYTGHDSLGEPTKLSEGQKLFTSHSFALQTGSFFPITLLSDNSALAFNVELLFSYSEFDYDSIIIHPDIVYDKRVPYVIMGIPLSVDYKTGGDVSLSKKRRQMFAAGAGLLPCLSTPAAVNRVSQEAPPLAIVPFAKLEFGFFAGVAFKLRGVAYLRRGINLNKTDENIYFPPDELKLKVHSGYGYHLSLIIMPFSYGWRTEEWY